jgi:hypothetical protein
VKRGDALRALAGSMRGRACAAVRSATVTVVAVGLATAPAAAQRAEVLPIPPEVEAVLSERLTAGRATIRFEPVDSVLARAVAERIRTQAPLPAVPDTIPWGATIFLPRTESVIETLLQGARPEWSAALARPADGWIILPAGRGEPTGRRDLIGEVLRHEWAHIGLHQAVGGYRGPRWFVEGYAQWAGGWDSEAAWRLRIALATNDSLSLNALTLRWPRERAEAEIAYLVAATVVDYLVEQSGERGLAIFIERWAASGDFEGALRATYGLTSGRLEEDWSRWAKDRYGWLYVLTRSGVGWGLLGGLFFMLVWARRRYRKDQMAALRAREIPDAPEWWAMEGAGRGDAAATDPGASGAGSPAPTLGTSAPGEYPQVAPNHPDSAIDGPGRPTAGEEER